MDQSPTRRNRPTGSATAGTTTWARRWESLEPILDAIRALGELYDNPETVREDAALAAARDGRPAYWTSARYHNQAALLLAQTANVSGLTTALRRWADDDYPSPAKHTAYLLSTLIPLNAAASAELHEAIAGRLPRAA